MREPESRGLAVLAARLGAMRGEALDMLKERLDSGELSAARRSERPALRPPGWRCHDDRR
jgi:hypothetical protein